MKLLFLLFISFSFVYAQSYEEFLRSQNEAFSAYKEERDKAFSSYLKEEWKAYKQSVGRQPYEEKKPEALPLAEISVSKQPKEKVIVHKLPPAVANEIKPFEQLIIPPKVPEQITLIFDFFGVELGMHYDKSMKLDIRGEVSKQMISKAWESLAKSEYVSSLNELKTFSKKLHLNDWAIYLLIKQVASHLYKNENEERIFTWFMLLKMDFDAHLAYQNNKVVLLLPIKGDLYNTVYYTLNQKHYYAIDYYAKGKLGSVMTYDNTYEGSSKELDFSIKTLPLFAQEKVYKSFFFKMHNKNNNVSLAYDKNLFKFYATYPQVSYSHYFSAPASIFFDESLQKAFEPMIVGQSQSEALDLLLAFVQKAFGYKVDVKQFNEEKVMFPSETLFYDYSDCEDRAILFAYMVKRLLNLEVVGLKYTNHMSTAVHLLENIEGEYINFKKKRYIVADPTYVNAKLGLSMPAYAGKNSYSIVATGAEK